MSPELNRAITRGMMAIEAYQPVIGIDGLNGAERECVEMLTWMSWQQIAALPAEIRDALDTLEAQGIVERKGLRPGLPPTLVRLRLSRQGGEHG